MVLNKIVIFFNKKNYHKNFQIKYSELNLIDKKKFFYNISDKSYLNIEIIYFDEKSPLLNICKFFTEYNNGIFQFKNSYEKSVKITDFPEKLFNQTLILFLSYYLNHLDIFSFSIDKQIEIFLSFNMIENLISVEKIAIRKPDKKLLKFYIKNFLGKKTVLYKNFLSEINELFLYIRSDILRLKISLFLLQYLRVDEINSFYKHILFEENEMMDYLLFKIYNEFIQRGYYRYAIFICYVLLRKGKQKYSTHIYNLIISLNDSITLNLFTNSNFYKFLYERKKTYEYLEYENLNEKISFYFNATHNIYKRRDGLIDYTEKEPFIINDKIILNISKKIFVRKIFFNSTYVKINRLIEKKHILKINSSDPIIEFKYLIYGEEKRLKLNIKIENLKLPNKIFQTNEKIIQFKKNYFLYLNK